MIARKDYRHTERIYRVEDGGEQQLTTGTVDPLHYNLVGTDTWEAAERSLLDFWSGLDDKVPGTYRILVTRHDGGLVVDVTRKLPLHPAYAALTYNRPASGNAPVRAFVVKLTELYPGLTLEQAADHVDAFSEHYRAEISTDQLFAATGYQLPADAPRPLSPYAKFQHIDDVPAGLR